MNLFEEYFPLKGKMFQISRKTERFCRMETTHQTKRLSPCTENAFIRVADRRA